MMLRLKHTFLEVCCAASDVPPKRSASAPQLGEWNKDSCGGLGPSDTERLDESPEEPDSASLASSTADASGAPDRALGTDKKLRPIRPNKHKRRRKLEWERCVTRALVAAHWEEDALRQHLPKGVDLELSALLPAPECHLDPHVYLATCVPCCCQCRLALR
mmetsp:Transcript_8621/g.23699  ORF Transcript_8621/g.23699 Transcript_8621/m.23699 type:complete len:161 (+) Transcript_8621:82-564(+)